MKVGELIKELQFWDKDLLVLVENNQMGDGIKEVVKDEYFYDEESDEYLVDEEEGVSKKRVIILIKYQ